MGQTKTKNILTFVKSFLIVVAMLGSVSSMAFGSKAPKPSDPVRAPGSVQEVRWESRHNQGHQWTTHVHNTIESLGSNLLTTTPSDIQLFCPNYTNLSRTNKKKFWTYLLSSMAQFESNFNPSLQYRENFKDRNGNYIISRGLLQLSQESSNGYGCNIRDAQELHNPFVNLSCAIRIINRWVGTDKSIAGREGNNWRGGARYWSVLRSTGHNRVSSIRQWTSEFCQRL